MSDLVGFLEISAQTKKLEKAADDDKAPSSRALKGSKISRVTLKLCILYNNIFNVMQSANDCKSDLNYAVEYLVKSGKVIDFFAFFFFYFYFFNRKSFKNENEKIFQTKIEINKWKQLSMKSKNESLLPLSLTDICTACDILLEIISLRIALTDYGKLFRFWPIFFNFFSIFSKLFHF